MLEQSGLTGTWDGRDYQLDVVGDQSQEVTESLQCRPDEEVREPHHQILARRPAHLQGGGQQPVQRSQDQVKEKVGAIDVERDQAPHQEGDLHQVDHLSLQLRGQSQVQQGGQGEDNPAFHPAWSS